MRGDDLRGGGREVLGCETAVVTDHDAATRLAALLDPLGHGLRADSHRIERVFLGDARAPAVGAEHDLHAVAPRPGAPTPASVLTWLRQYSSVSSSEVRREVRGA